MDVFQENGSQRSLAMFPKHVSFLSRPGFMVIASLVLVMLIGLVPVGYAQEVSAGITGSVTDPSQAAIVGATVVATEVDRGTVWTTESNAVGVYSFPRIPPGRYEVRVEAQGFRAFRRSDVRLEINQRARLDISMELGAVTETVEVTGEVPLLSTEKTEVGSVLTGETNVNLPLNGRNYISLTLLAAGVTTTNPQEFVTGRRTAGGGRPYVNGNRKEANNFLLDGIDNNQVSDNLVAYQPSVDAVSEFKMITNNASAEFGNFQGGIINVTIKGGTNEFHGTAFEFFRNDKLNANNWARNWQKLDKNPLRMNVFGGTFGGPVKRDKLFFFADYQGTRRAEPGSPENFNVFASDLRQGDFSRVLTEQKIQLFDPASLAGGVRSPFPNNIIPMSRIDPVAAKLFSSPDLYPAPINNGLRFNQVNQTKTTLQTDQGDIKLDWKTTDRDDVSVRYSKSVQTRPITRAFPLTFGNFDDAPFQAGVINWTRMFSPTVVNEARVGVNNIMYHTGGAAGDSGNIAEQLGITNGNDRGPGLFNIQFVGGLATNLGSANIGTQTLFANTTYQFVDNMTVSMGRHMMKTGFQLLRQQINSFYAGNNGRTGLMAFNGQYTSGSGSNGLADADFFLGAPYRVARGVNTGTWGHRKNIVGAYFQDDWRATDTLTLNLGVRWEYHTPLYEVNDRQSNFEPFTGKLLMAGQDGNSRALYNGYWKDFQPRIGFAWTPGFLEGGKTVLRGAYTISSFMEGTGTNLRMPLNPPFNVEFETLYDKGDALLIPQSNITQGLTVLQALDPFKNVNIRLWDPNVRPANVQQWSLIVERQLPQDTVVTVGYVGQHGTHLVVPMPYYQLRLNADGTTQPSGYLSGNPQLSQIAQISGTESNGNQRYDSLQLTARRRLASGFQYQLAYTYSKGMSDAIGYYGEGGQAANQSAYWQNLFDRPSEWGPTYFDATHMFSYSYVYELPFGRNKAFGSNWNPVVNGILGGWQMGGILTLRSGFPWTIQATDVSGTRSRGARADHVGADSTIGDVGPGTKWFDTSAYRAPVKGTFGNTGIGTVRGPGLKNFDLSLQKSFPVKEGQRLEFRAEFFNLTNTPTFNAAQRNVNSATFGEITGAQGERNVQFALKFYF
jgi:hypothetical protein